MSKKVDKTSFLVFILINILSVVLVVVFTLFNSSWKWDFVLPHWEVFTKTGEIWFINVGEVKLAQPGDDGAYWAPGALLIAIIIQFVGYMIYLNTRWGKLLELSYDMGFMSKNKIIENYTYLISDDDFIKRIATLDRANKVTSWRLYIMNKIHKFNSRRPKYVLNEELVETKSKRTLKWLAKLKKLEIQQTNDWIDENIHRVKINYPKINVRMVISGSTNINTSHSAISDEVRYTRCENINKLIWALISITVVTFFISFSIVNFKEDVWNTIKDFVIYGVALILNIIMGKISATKIHEVRVLNRVERIGIIQGYVGKDSVDATKKLIAQEATTNRILELKEMLNKEE